METYFVTEESKKQFGGHNPAFYRRVMEKRLKQQQKAAAERREADRIALEKELKARREAALATDNYRSIDVIPIPGQRAVEQALIKKAKEQGDYRPPYTVIERRICRALGITKREIHSARRHREVTLARQAVMYWASRLTNMSLPEIGRRLGGKDHTTVMHGKKRYPDRREQQGRFLREVK